MLAAAQFNIDYFFNLDQTKTVFAQLSYFNVEHSTVYLYFYRRLPKRCWSTFAYCRRT